MVYSANFSIDTSKILPGGGALSSKKPFSLKSAMTTNTAVLTMLRMNRAQCPSILVQPRPAPFFNHSLNLSYFGNKKFDAVKMMREIQDKLSKRYSEDLGAEKRRDLQDIKNNNIIPNKRKRLK